MESFDLQIRFLFNEDSADFNETLLLRAGDFRDCFGADFVFAFRLGDFVGDTCLNFIHYCIKTHNFVKINVQVI